MPKTKPTELEMVRRQRQAVIDYGMALTGTSEDDIAKRLGLCKKSIQRKRKYPETIPLDEARIIAKMLHLTDEQKAQLIG